MSTFLSPLQTGLISTPSGWTSPVWDAWFWLTQQRYLPPSAPPRRSARRTRVWLAADKTEWRVHFDCEAGSASDAAPLRALGDPDLWEQEYVQLQMPSGHEGGCLHLTVTRAGQMISERHDKNRDPLEGWHAETVETVQGWSAWISVPRTASPADLRLRMARWVPDEGITRWPTSYGTWWHVDEPDFLQVGLSLPPESDLEAKVELFMKSREAALFSAYGTSSALAGFPTAVQGADLLQAARGFVDLPLEREGDLLAHLKRRVRQSAWLAFDSPPAPDESSVRGLLENRLYYDGAFLELGPNPDWDGDNGNYYLMVHATRFDFLADMVAVFRQSGDERYARHAVALIESWMAGDDVRDSLAPERHAIRWRTGIIVSHRLVCMARTLFSLLDTGFVSEALLFKLYAAVREAAAVLSPRMARLYSKNHSIIIGDHMVQLSILCEELRDAAAIRQEYYEHLRRALEAQFLPDGTQAELSTTYLLVCYQRLTEATSLSERCGVNVPPEITAWRRRILETAAKYLLPNGMIAAFNDGRMGEAVDAIGQEDHSLRSLILQDGPELGVEAALEIGRGGHLAEPSSFLPFAGHYILRDGLTPDSMALAFDAGPFGIAHAHEDALSVMMVRYGKPLLIDIGSGAYDLGVPMREYSVSTRSHSTICIDGHGQNSARFPESWKRSTPWNGHHHFGPLVQFAHGEYVLGYGIGDAAGARHERAVLFVNGSYVLLVDYLLGTGFHRIESHFAVAPLPYELTGRGLRTVHGNGDLDIQLLYPPNPEIAVAEGQEHPFAGWMPEGAYGLLPHPRLTFGINAQLPCCLITLLSPFQSSDELPHVQMEESPEDIRLTIERAGATSTVTCSRLPMRLNFQDSETFFGVQSGEEGLTFHDQ